MTFDEYVANPMGRSNAVLSGAVRESQRNIYTHKFDNILLRENGKIEYFMYQAKDNVYYIHIKIPSEVVKNFYYDVVLKFSPGEGAMKANGGLDKYQVQFYSNDPAFVYTYAYVFNKKGLFIKELAPKMSKKAIRQPASEKNPENQVGYVKSIYFAYLFMKRRGLFNKLRWGEAQPYSLKSLIANIENADDKIAERQEEGAKVSKRKTDALSRSDYNKLKRIGGKDLDLSNVKVKTTKKVGVVANKASNSKSVTRTKSTKKF